MFLRALGTVTPLVSVAVRPRISGQLLHVGFEEGQVVHQGDVLAQIDPRLYQQALDQALGNLRRDQALLRKAGPNAADGQFAGAVQAYEAAVASARLNLQFTHITAPVSGRTGLRLIDQGDHITPATALVIIKQLQPISVLTPVMEEDATRIAKRLAAGTKLPVILYDRSPKARLGEGSLTALDSRADVNTATVVSRAFFDNTDGALLPGQLVNVHLVVDTLRDQLLIPTSAVRSRIIRGSVASSFVYVVNRRDSTIRLRPVQPGASDDEHVVVTSGLSVGEVVVNRGDVLHDGDKVQLPGARTT